MDNSPLDAILSTSSVSLWVLGILGGAALLGLLVHALLTRLARRVLAQLEETTILRGILLPHAAEPLRILVPLLFVYAARPLVWGEIGPSVATVLGGALYILLIVGTTWLLISALVAGEDAITTHYEIDVPDNLKARKLVTQVRILRQIATVVIVVLATGLVLLQFEPVRQLGTGILASAGIVGIVVGVAAQGALRDLIAGIQIALTQPIRVDDVVIAEGEFGWIEEITLTYVVVRVWDRRRIVMPITHFVEKPFQNWTRTSADLIGSVFLRVDYRTPVSALREELQRVVEASEYWDGDACALHVTDTTERAIEVRAIASAQSAPHLWELRCEIREALVAYLRDHHPEALPVVRMHVQGGDGDAGREGLERSSGTGT